LRYTNISQYRYAMEQFYCVSDEPFERSGKSFKDFTRCRDGQYLQLFNQHVFVEHNARYSLMIE